MIIEHLADAAGSVQHALGEMAKQAPLTPRLRQVNEHLGRVLEEFELIDLKKQSIETIKN